MAGSDDGSERASRRDRDAPSSTGRRSGGAAHGLPDMMHFHILQERPSDAALIEPLLDRCFGPGRHQKTVYRLRAELEPIAGLSFVATDDAGTMLASLRFWPVRIAGTPAVLLGPLAVEPALQGRGIGRALMRHGLDAARRRGERLCVLVGEPDYYAPFGFVPAAPAGLVLPGPVEPRRFLVQELVPGALEAARGLIEPDPARGAAAGSRRCSKGEG